VTLRIDITGLPPERLVFVGSPLAELTAMLHVLAAPEHHPRFAQWAAGVRAGLQPELLHRLHEADLLWRSSRADFLLPARPRGSLAEELDDVDRIDDERYVASALITTCGSNRVSFGEPSPLSDPVARDRALAQAQARGALQEAFTQRLLADPATVRAHVREILAHCAEAFFDAAWPAIAVRLATDARLKDDLVRRQGPGMALASVSSALTLAPDGDCIVLDKLQDSATSARESGVTFIPAASATRTWSPSTAGLATGGAVPGRRARRGRARAAEAGRAAAGRARAPGASTAGQNPGPQPAHHG
jgi:hypothetical protein